MQDLDVRDASQASVLLLINKGNPVVNYKALHSAPCTLASLLDMPSVTGRRAKCIRLSCFLCVC